MFCAKCGAQTAPVDKFCAFCGTPNIPIAPPPAPTPYEIRRQEKLDEFNEWLNDMERYNFNVDTTITDKLPATDISMLHFSTITKSTIISSMFPLVVLDVETTGLNKYRTIDIIEVSAIKFISDFEPESCFTTLTKPKKPIPAEASAVNNITDSMVANAPPFFQICQSFNDYISGCNIAGHNLQFDLSFLSANGVIFPSRKTKYYDTLAISQKVLKKPRYKYNREYESYEIDYEDYDVYDHKLDTLCSYYGIVRDSGHRSLSDCLATSYLLTCLIKDIQ